MAGLRTADENAAAAGRVAGAGGFEGSGDGDLVEMRRALGFVVVESGALELLPDFGGLRGGLAEERYAYGVRSGFDTHAEGKTRVDLIGSFGGAGAGTGVVVVAAEVRPA